MTTPAVSRSVLSLAVLTALVVVSPLFALAEAPRPDPSRQVDILVRDMLAAQKGQLADRFARHGQAADDTPARGMRPGTPGGVKATV
nr:hypothetical protein [bacterium]